MVLLISIFRLFGRLRMRLVKLEREFLVLSLLWRKRLLSRLRFVLIYLISMLMILCFVWRLLCWFRSSSGVRSLRLRLRDWSIIMMIRLSWFRSVSRNFLSRSFRINFWSKLLSCSVSFFGILRSMLRRSVKDVLVVLSFFLGLFLSLRSLLLVWMRLLILICVFNNFMLLLRLFVLVWRMFIIFGYLLRSLLFLRRLLLMIWLLMWLLFLFIFLFISVVFLFLLSWLIDFVVLLLRCVRCFFFLRMLVLLVMFLVIFWVRWCLRSRVWWLVMMLRVFLFVFKFFWRRVILIMWCVRWIFLVGGLRCWVGIGWVRCVRCWRCSRFWM